MSLDIKDVLKLSDNKQYVVTSKTIYNNDEYLYIVDINDSVNVKVCRVTVDSDKTNLIIVKDEELIKVLVPLFQKNLLEFAK